MKFQLMSDLHLEFEPYFRPTNGGADVLILSGDICVGSKLGVNEDSPYHWKSELWKDFFQHCSDTFKHTVYVPGNHEYYHGHVGQVEENIREELRQYGNIYFLDNKCVYLDGIQIVGTALWTDCNKSNPLTTDALNRGLNDFRLVTYKDGDIYRKFRAEDSIKLHRKALSAISDACVGEEKVIVVGHHAPSEQSIHSKYKHDYHLNGGYYSDLETFILERPEIKVWTHGHMHNSFDYKIGLTRVLCNPRGYNDENKAFNPTLVFEV